MCCCSQGKPQTVTYLDKWQLLWLILAGWAEVRLELSLLFYCNLSVCPPAFHSGVVQVISMIPLSFFPPSFSVLTASSLLKITSQSEHSVGCVHITLLLLVRKRTHNTPFNWLSKNPPNYSREMGINSLQSIRASIWALILRCKQRHLDLDDFQSPSFHLCLWAVAFVKLPEIFPSWASEQEERLSHVPLPFLAVTWEERWCCTGRDAECIPCSWPGWFQKRYCAEGTQHSARGCSCA